MFGNTNTCRDIPRAHNSIVLRLVPCKCDIHTTVLSWSLVDIKIYIRLASHTYSHEEITVESNSMVIEIYFAFECSVARENKQCHWFDDRHQECAFCSYDMVHVGNTRLTFINVFFLFSWMGARSITSCMCRCVTITKNMDYLDFTASSVAILTRPTLNAEKPSAA